MRTAKYEFESSEMHDTLYLSTTGKILIGNFLCAAILRANTQGQKSLDENSMGERPMGKNNQTMEEQSTMVQPSCTLSELHFELAKPNFERNNFTHLRITMDGGKVFRRAQIERGATQRRVRSLSDARRSEAQR